MKKQPAKKAKSKTPTTRKAVVETIVKKKTTNKDGRKSFPIVAIGASAGGVEATTELFKHLPSDLGMAYVVVHHLSPGYNSQLADILQRHSEMKVSRITSGVEIVADNVYVIPQNKMMTIVNGHLKLRDRTKTDVHPIDHFMETLASVYQHNAVGILLSGTDSDGTLGLKAIKLEGGITFAQDETARHMEMPTRASKSGYVDFVLPPARIAQELSTLILHRRAVTSANDEATGNDVQIKKILSLVLDRFEVDFFSHYKRTTVNRRIMRRMALNKITTFAEYYKKVRSDRNEIEALYNDFLINVTSFFREPSFYAGLKKIIFPQILKNRKSSEPIRIWIPGCSTGEEAYSTAISITEFLEGKKVSAPVQIFSTDLDEKAIHNARLGVYSKNSIARISATRLERFFKKIDGHYQIHKSIRDMCVFSVHNLMKDPPFSRIDLVSCQNVLIYIEAAPQRRILQTFHYALKPGGFLLLGKSETIGNSTDLFQSFEKEPHLYKKKHLSKLSLLNFTIRGETNGSAHLKSVPEPRTQADVESEFDKVLLSRYVPASALVNKDLEILRFRGSTSAFFQPATGKASLNLLKMVKEELIFEIRGLFQKAKKSNSAVVKEGISVDSVDDLVTIEVAPIKSGKEIYYYFVFKSERNGAVAKIKTGKKSDQRSAILKLEQALKEARDHVRTTTEDFDVAREELQSANEEILSSNEELQSINEELETSKEELQSANEELTTINEELQNRIAELKQSHDYVEAIIDTMHGPLVVVSAQMRVRTANKSFYEFFKLKQEETEGRYIHELGNGRWDIPALSIHVRDILPKRMKFKNFEVSHDFPEVGPRTMIVNAHALVSAGTESQILLAFQDITDFRNNERKLKIAQEQLKLALVGGSVGTWAWDIKSNMVDGSREQQIIFGRDGDFFKTFDEWEKAVYHEDVVPLKESIKRSWQQRKPLDIEFRIQHQNGNTRWILSKANTYFGPGGEPVRMMGVSIDITERKQAVEALAESERRFHMLSDQAPVMIWMTDEKQHCNFVNKTWVEFTGKSFEAQIGTGWLQAIHPDDRESFASVYKEAYDNRKEFRTDYRLKRKDGVYRWVLNHGVPRYTNRESFIGYIGTCVDITDRIDIEKQKDDFMGIASHELKTPVTSIKAYAQILHDRFTKAGDQVSASMLARLDGQIDKLTGLINALLDVTRIQTGQMDIESTNFGAASFVQEIAEEMQASYPKHKIVTKIDLDNGIEVFADRGRSAQVLRNLLSNAAKYSAEDTKIIVKASAQDKEVIIEVQDFGSGIEQGMQEKIFERFFRASGGAGASGLGLGLFICSEIVKHQGGRIWVKSTPGKGSVFSFTIPRADS
jgi:two-component system, chemotaxis family, CheB/CheR fusion protein